VSRLYETALLLFVPHAWVDVLECSEIDMTRDEFNKLHSLIMDHKGDEVGSRLATWKLAHDYILEQFLDMPKSTRKLSDDDAFRYRTLKKGADSILWLHLDHEPADMRRFLEGQISLQNLSHHNIECHQKYSEEIFEKTGFVALVADLCSSSKTGDILVLFPDGRVIPIEVKEGDVNHRILDAIQERDRGHDAPYRKLLGDEQYAKQVKRIERQTRRLKHETTLYFTNESVTEDSVYKTHLHPFDVIDYQSSVDAAVEEAIKSGSARSKVDDCFDVIAVDKAESVDDLTDQIRREEAMQYGFYSIAAKEDALTRPIWTLDMQKDRKFHLLTGSCMVMFIFYPRLFCEKYSSPECRFEILEQASDAPQISAILPGHPGVSFGPGLYQRLFSFLIHPKSVAEQGRFLAERWIEHSEKQR
jgi:hypothetical protein